MAYYKFCAVFETCLLPELNQRMVSRSVSVEVLTGPKVLPGMLGMSKVNSKAERTVLIQPHSIVLKESHWYIVIESRVREQRKDPKEYPTMHDLGYAYIDEAIAVISALYTIDVFGIEIYRGPLYTGGRLMAGTDFKICPPVAELDGGLFDGLLRNTEQRSAIEADHRRKVQLIGKFIDRSVTAKSIDEKYLFLWTILEIHPMKGTSHIQSIKDLIKRLCPISEGKSVKWFDVGRMNGYRSNLVHDGYLGIPDRDIGSVFGALENLARVALRDLLNLPYDGSLDTYFESP